MLSVSDQTQPGDSPAVPLLPVPPPTKSKPRTSREFERALRELGYSKTEARSIASHGFKGLQVEDPAEDVSELAALIERNTHLFERIERTL